MKTLLPVSAPISHNPSVPEPVPRALAALCLVLTLNLGAQVNTGSTPTAGVTTQVISTNAAQPVTMVIVHGQPTASATAGPMSPLTPGCCPCPASAVAWWAGEGNLLDSLGAHSDGWILGPVSYMPGQIGQAFRFIGYGCVAVPNSGLIFPSWSFEAWVNPTEVPINPNEPTNQVWIVGQGFGRQLILRPGTSGAAVVCLAVSTSLYYWQVLEGPEIPLNAWSHVVGVCDSASGKLRLYVNGGSGGQAEASLLFAPWDSGFVWSIGGYGYWEGFKGGLDEVTVYNGALTGPQVQVLYSAGAAGKCLSPNTLAFHMATNAFWHSLGHTDIDLATKVVINGYPYTAWNPDCWLLGVDGLSATSIGYWDPAPPNLHYGYPVLTMISPRHCLFTAHAIGFYPSPFVFLGKDGLVYTANLVDRIELQDDELTVGIMDPPLPTDSVGFLPVLDPNYATYLPTDSSSYVQGIGGKSELNQPRVFSQPMNLLSPIVIWDPNHWITPAGFGLGADWSMALHISDSSSPQRFLINNQLVLVSAAWVNTIGPNYATQTVDIQDAMNHLSDRQTPKAPRYTLGVYDLTGWPHIQ
jgi:hypothetical protein